MGSYRSAMFILLLLCSLALFGCEDRAQDLEQVSKEERIVIKFSHVVAESTPKGLAARRFADLIKERTEGRVEVQVYPNSVLFNDGEEMQALYHGQVQMIAPATAKIAERFPLWQLFDLPFLFNSEEEVHRVMDGAAGQQLIRMLEPHLIKAVAMWDNGFKQITTTVPLRKLEDFHGVRFRVMPGSKILEGQFRHLWAETIPLPFNEVYHALEGGRVQGFENSASNLYSKKFYEIQPYLTISNHGYLGYAVLVNGDFWNNLPQDIRVILEDTLQEVTEWQREVATRQNAINLQAIVDSGKVDVWELTPEEQALWRQMMSPVYRDYENLGGKGILAIARADIGLTSQNYNR